MAEIRPVPFADGYYVSDDGRVFSTVRGAMRELVPWNHTRGKYLVVGMQAAGASVRKCVHRLVALVFIGSPPTPDHEVRHLDGDPRNNNVGNLAWGTHKENMQDMVLHGHQGACLHPERMARGERHGSKTKPHRTPRGESSGSAKITEQIVRDIRRTFAETKCISETARRTGAPRGATKCIIQGKTWKHVT